MDLRAAATRSVIGYRDHAGWHSSGRLWSERLCSVRLFRQVGEPQRLFEIASRVVNANFASSASHPTGGIIERLPLRLAVYEEWADARCFIALPAAMPARPDFDDAKSFHTIRV